jgi:short-subunit dehydrogenase
VFKRYSWVYLCSALGEACKPKHVLEFALDVQNYGPWALIIGGSEGIGAAFARKLAAAKFNVILIARKVEPLEALAKEVRETYGVQVRAASVDLAKADALDQVRKQTDDVDVGLLICNAGANNTRGDFVDLPDEVWKTVISVNINVQAEFSHHYGAKMKARGRGGIMLCGSGAGYIGAPSLAAYCGAKAFSRIFSEALWGECQAFGVDVLHLLVGYTATPAMARLGYILDTAQSPEDCAQEGLDNIANGPVWVAGGEGNLQRALDSAAFQPRSAAVLSVVPPPRQKP